MESILTILFVQQIFFMRNSKIESTRRDNLSLSLSLSLSSHLTLLFFNLSLWNSIFQSSSFSVSLGIISVSYDIFLLLLLCLFFPFFFPCFLFFFLFICSRDLKGFQLTDVPAFLTHWHNWSHCLKINRQTLAQSAGAVKYTDCISAEG